MKKLMLVLAAGTAMWAAPVWAQSGADAAREVLALERQALDGWLSGNPEPLLAIVDPEITYVHQVVGKRIVGLPALKGLFAQYRGTPLFDRYELLDPKVQSMGDVVVLTYQLAQIRGSATNHWNGTQVYRKTKEGWRVIHTHWSEAKVVQP